MPNDLIRYDLLVQEALCGVVKKVLGDAARHGLPGDHHFYITFRTHGPGVRLSNRMRELYPEEMTIILQHQFEDLKVSDYAFEVGLSFKGVPEILLVPFEALTGFFDPSVQFSAKFEPQAEADEAGQATILEPAPRPLGLPAPIAPAPTPLASVPNTGKTNAGKTIADKPGAGRTNAGKPNTGAADPAKLPERKVEHATAVEPGAGDEAKVVSIDAFRKKP